MNITDEQREKLERLEAHLRGYVWHEERKRWCKDPESFAPGFKQPDGSTGPDIHLCGDFYPNPPDTSFGHAWWAEALKMHVGTLPPSTIWRATTWAINPKESVSCARESRSEAITAAILAAAEAWEAAK